MTVTYVLLQVRTGYCMVWWPCFGQLGLSGRQRDIGRLLVPVSVRIKGMDTKPLSPATLETGKNSQFIHS